MIIMTDLRVLLAYNIKKRRQTLGITQEKLADKVSTSTHYIGQIEQKNKFPSPEMLVRIAEALEMDTPQLFSMETYTDDAVKRFEEGFLSDVTNGLETVIAKAVKARIS